MDNETRLSKDELDAIAERKADNYGFTPNGQIVTNYGHCAYCYVAARDDVSQLLKHIRTLETDLAIATAQAGRDWFAKP